MGGDGSGGRHDGYAPRLPVESCVHLGTKELLEKGGIRPGKIAEAVCSNGKVTFRLTIDATIPESYTYRLEYTTTATYRDGTEAKEKIDETHELAITHPNYGGSRYWFRCPKCHKRTTKLYLPYYNLRFRCRKCHKLTYHSTLHSHDEERDFMRWSRMLAWVNRPEFDNL